ncbi:MAG: hypothetical protein AAF939_17160 [Planctomycetota bacterium]
MKPSSFVVLLIFFGLPCVRPIGCAGDEDSLEKVSDVCCLIVSLDEPKRFFDRLAVLDPSWFDSIELANDFLNLGPYGLERKGSQIADLNLVLREQSSISLLVEDCSSELGNIAVVISHDDGKKLKEKCTLVKNFLSLFTKLLTVNPTSTGKTYEKLTEHLKIIINDSLVAESDGGHTVIATSMSFRDLILRRLVQDSPARKDERAYLMARNYFRQNADVRLFWNTRSAKKLLIELGYYSALTWDSLRAESIPWSALSISMEHKEEDFFWDFETSYGLTFPLTGTNRIFEIAQPIDSFPDIPDEAISYSIEAFDLKALAKFNQVALGELYGKDFIEQVQSDELIKLEMGIGRENLGSTAVNINFGYDHKEFLKLYSTEYQNDINESAKFVRSYLAVLRQSDKTGRSLHADYDSAEHSGVDVEWDFELEDIAGRQAQIMEWLSSQNLLEAPKAMPKKFERRTPTTITFSIMKKCWRRTYLDIVIK